jgi:hypothetical protein
MTWILTQNDSSFSGTVTMRDTASGVTGTGTVSGTVSGSALQFSLSVPAGGFSSGGACSATVAGSGTATASAISGSYAGSNSCVGSLSSGQLTLNKQ